MCLQFQVLFLFAGFPLTSSLFQFSVTMGKMYKKKQAHGRGPPREQNNKQENEMDIRKIMEDVQNFSIFSLFFFFFFFLKLFSIECCLSSR